MKREILFLIILILTLSCDVVAQKPGKKYFITGHVTDINDKPVSDAIVLVDNLNTKVATDATGLYKVKVKRDATSIAVFKPVNGQSEEEINGRTVINFRLSAGTPLKTSDEQVKPADDEINVGYGTSSRKNLSTTVSRIDGQKKQFVAYQSVYEMLQQDPSVQVNGKKITIRGINTINNTDPLFVVDGMVVSSIDDISPQTVKSIEILKGSNAAIYGSRGGNGVILITLTH
jgi:TonB-dependent SusC/RagA subfamily outer membrane receptor